MDVATIFAGVVLLLAIALLFSVIKIVPQGREFTVERFGKYKGTLLADLPSHYLGWFAQKGFPKGQLGRLLALMHEVDQAGARRLLDPLRRP